MTASEQAFERHWDRNGHCQRMRDKKDLMGLNKGARLADFSKPSDFIVSSRTEPLHYAEVKETKSKNSFGFSGIRPAQSAAAIKEARSGSEAYKFYIWSWHHSKWFVMTCTQFYQLIESKRKSVKFEELTEWHR